jgi:hypothetical protein
MTAITPRRRTRTRASEPAQPAASPPAAPDLAAVVDVMARMLARLIVHVSRAKAVQPARFRQIVTQELRVGTDAEVDLIEAWLTSRPGG